LSDTHFKYLCIGDNCGVETVGELIDPEYAAAERRKFEALCAEVRRRDAED